MITTLHHLRKCTVNIQQDIYYENLMKTKEITIYTLHFPSMENIKHTDYTGLSLWLTCQTPITTQL